MKRQLFLNRRLYELDLFEQNKYLGERINTIKPAIYNKPSSLDYKIYFTNKNMIKRQST